MPAPTKTTNTIRMPGYIDRWYSFAQRGLISQRDLKTDSHLELPLPKITVRFFHRKSILVDATSTDTILAIKMRIFEALTKHPADQQDLFSFSSMVKLEDNSTLAACGILCQEDSIVLCRLRVRGGGVFGNLSTSLATPPTSLLPLSSGLSSPAHVHFHKTTLKASSLASEASSLSCLSAVRISLARTQSLSMQIHDPHLLRPLAPLQLSPPPTATCPPISLAMAPQTYCDTARGEKLNRQASSPYSPFPG